MNYKEYLNLVKEKDIYIGKMIVAVEVDSQIENLSETAYERVCEFIYQCYLKSDGIDAGTLAWYFNYKLVDGVSVDEIIKQGVYKFIEEAESVGE